MVGRPALKPEAAWPWPERGPGLQGCLTAGFQIPEELCKVLLQDHRCCHDQNLAVVIKQPRKSQSGLAILGTMQMCMCLQQRIRGRSPHRQRQFIPAAL